MRYLAPGRLGARLMLKDAASTTWASQHPQYRLLRRLARPAGAGNASSPKRSRLWAGIDAACSAKSSAYHYDRLAKERMPCSLVLCTQYDRCESVSSGRRLLENHLHAPAVNKQSDWQASTLGKSPPRLFCTCGRRRLASPTQAPPARIDALRHCIDFRQTLRAKAVSAAVHAHFKSG